MKFFISMKIILALGIIFAHRYKVTITTGL